jgi:hypothetical protein
MIFSDKTQWHETRKKNKNGTIKNHQKEITLEYVPQKLTLKKVDVETEISNF